MKWFVVYMMITGHATSTETHPVDSFDACRNKGTAWVNAMEHASNTPWLTRAEFECIQLPE